MKTQPKDIAPFICTCQILRKADRMLSQMYDNCLRPAGLRSTQFGLLKHIEKMPEPFISDIGRAMGMDQTTVTRNLEILEKQGLVVTTPHPDDPRKKRVALTPMGKAKIVEAFPLWEKAQTKIGSQLGAERLEDLHTLLNAVAKAAKTP